jgi:uncharacterized protein YecT (DUF1311 family)
LERDQAMREDNGNGVRAAMCALGSVPALVRVEGRLRAWKRMGALVVSGLIASTATAGAVDCQRASRPIEDLICGDAELLRLDALLAEALAGRRETTPEAGRAALLAEERAWADESLVRCRVPAVGEPLGLPQQWQAAPCLAEFYRERLSRLGRPQPAVATAHDSGFIHPLCVDLVVGTMNNLDGDGTPEQVSVPLNACNQGHRHIAVEKTADGFLAAEGASDGFRTRVAYRIVGTLKDGRLIAQLNSSSGAGGVVSEIDELRRAAVPGQSETMLSGRILLEGGERCNGGIARAEVIEGRLLQVDYHATPMDLLATSAEDFPLDAYDGQIDACEECCFATLRYRHDPATGEETFVGATVKEIGAAAPPGTPPRSAAAVQACFEKRVRQAAGQLPHTFSPQELRALADDVRQNCPLAPQR